MIQVLPSLPEALLATHGIVCVVGAGGKKSTLYRLIDQASGRVGFTATTMSTTPDQKRFDACILAEPGRLALDVPRAASHQHRIAYACPSVKSGRIAGLPPGLVARLHEHGDFNLTLVKADGARMRGIKAPRADEPCLVPGCSVVIFVVSAHVLGQPLTEAIAHRVPILAERLGMTVGERITPMHIGRLLSHPQGAWQGVEQCPLVTLINQVDSPGQRALAMTVAKTALTGEKPPSRVVLGSMIAEQPLIDILERPPGKAGAAEGQPICPHQ